MRNFNVPALSIEQPQQPKSTATAARPSAPDFLPPDHSPSEHPPPAIPAARRAPLPTWKEVFTMFARLRASFARSEAVHQARLDEFWSGPQRHLLAHYACSAK